MQTLAHPNRLNTVVQDAVSGVGGDPMRLLDVIHYVTRHGGRLDGPTVHAIADTLGIPALKVQAIIAFYGFFSEAPVGDIVVRLCDDVVDRLAGYDDVLAQLERSLGIALGETTPDGRISLRRTPCIGLCDQAPAALVNDVPVTHLTPAKVKALVAILNATHDPQALVQRHLGDGRSQDPPRISAMVRHNIRRAGPLLSASAHDDALQRALAMAPAQVIDTIERAGLRGRGGAGFPTARKWRYTRAAPGHDKVVICNADEGEPGTFKDRVLLTEWPERVLNGLTIAAYAVGATVGIVYLRGEYAYLLKSLSAAIEARRAAHLLGAGVGGRVGFDFDVRVQLGAGAYICGEESALIESCEGKPGIPRNRPPFPAQRGYLGRPTAVNNVETLCCVERILALGAATFRTHGTKESAGTKLLSISGDCARPGIYEVDFGLTVRAALALAGAPNAAAALVGGPSGQFVGPSAFDRALSFEDLPTGGALVVFGPNRDLLAIAHTYLEFFAEESCGLCTPCRVGTRVLAQGLAQVREGHTTPHELRRLKSLASLMSNTSRCGLGQCAANPFLSTLDGFPELYDALVAPAEEGIHRAFDLDASRTESDALQGASGGGDGR